MSSREVFFISILPVRDLRLKKFQSGGQEIVGFWSTSLWGFHSTLGCVYRVGIHGAMESVQVKALESSWSLLFLYCQHLEASCHRLSGMGSYSSYLAISYLLTLNKAARVSVPLGHGTLRRVTERG